MRRRIQRQRMPIGIVLQGEFLINYNEITLKSVQNLNCSILDVGHLLAQLYFLCSSSTGCMAASVHFFWSASASQVRSETLVLTNNLQCFGSIFIESGSGSSKKSQSGSGSRKALNPDPDPSYFFTLSEKKLKLCYYYKFLSSKEVN